MEKLEKGKKGKMFLEKYTKRINDVLKDFFREQKANFLPEFFYDYGLPVSKLRQTGMLDCLEEFCLRGGKRLRPGLVYLGHCLFKGSAREGRKDSDDVTKVSLAMELIHSFLLIHDDVMDESIMRRGKPTVHKNYEEECRGLYRNCHNPVRLGESLSILAGDLSHCLAFKLVSSINFSSDIKIRILNKLYQTIQTTIFGQELDLRFGAEGISRPKDILKMYRLKTAQYSFECPLQIGVILAGGNDEDLELMSSFAIPLGIAFQVQDDILGLFGDEHETGKSASDDIRQGKQTILITKALENGLKRERTVIRAALGSKDVRQKQIKEVQDIVKSTGSLSYAKGLSQAQLKRAKKALKKMGDRGYDKEALDILEEITDFVMERNK